MVNAILWVMRTGAPWAELPARYPPYQTCHRWFQRWSARGSLRALVTMLANDPRLRRRGRDCEAYIDGSYVPAKKGDRVLDAAEPATRRS